MRDMTHVPGHLKSIRLKHYRGIPTPCTVKGCNMVFSNVTRMRLHRSVNHRYVNGGRGRSGEWILKK
jgi:hypothetical protein